MQDVLGVQDFQQVQEREKQRKPSNEQSERRRRREIVSHVVDKYKRETIGSEKSLSLVLFRGKQPSAVTEHKAKQKRVEQRGKEIRRIEEGTNESK